METSPSLILVPSALTVLLWFNSSVEIQFYNNSKTMESNPTKQTASCSTEVAIQKGSVSSQSKTCELHNFSPDQAQIVRTNLLKWYDTSKRDLPWRRLTAKEEDRNRRGYAVWVSEVMLQQTQVATVVNYYNKWMARWPTLQDLSRATLEEVNEMWAGLGYYSRARRLHEGSKKVVNEMDGEMPLNAANLTKYLPGVGKYTAGAIASIAFNQPTGVVDGNVVRILSRLRVIGLDSSSSLAVDTFWNLVGELIDSERPGDLNQAMMELGATVCTPKTPQCKKCPVKDVCLAYKQVENSTAGDKKGARLRSYFQGHAEKTEGHVKDNSEDAEKTEGHVKDNSEDIEDLVSRDCQLCLKDGSWNPEAGVCNYPRKQKLKEARQERVAVCILACETHENETNSESTFFICKRPPTGLLAGLWEFPNLVMEKGLSEDGVRNKVQTFLKDEFKLELNGEEKQESLGEVQHLFSHIHHTYVVRKIAFTTKPQMVTGESAFGRSTKWVSKSEFFESAVSTAMKKVFNLYKNNGHKATGTKRKHQDREGSRKQRLLDSFFVKK